MPSPWTDEDRRNAVASIEVHGIADTHRATGIPKQTLSAWAKAAGIEAGRTGAEKTADANACRWANQKKEVTGLLGQVAIRSAQVQMAVLEQIQKDFNEAGVNGIKLDLARLSEIVGAGTRAIHDLQLLAGEATERPAAGDPDKLVEVGGDKLRLLRSG